MYNHVISAVLHFVIPVVGQVSVDDYRQEQSKLSQTVWNDALQLVSTAQDPSTVSTEMSIIESIKTETDFGLQNI